MNTENKTEIVYDCPFCNGIVFFNNPKMLIAHVLSTPSHVKALLNLFVGKCRKEIKKSCNKWIIPDKLNPKELI